MGVNVRGGWGHRCYLDDDIYVKGEGEKSVGCARNRTPLLISLMYEQGGFENDEARRGVYETSRAAIVQNIQPGPLLGRPYFFKHALFLYTAIQLAAAMD